jgi:hypothetical protein
MRIAVPLQRKGGSRTPFTDRQPDIRYRCPCCGYPTLPGRGHFDICELCNWEDDGQDDPYADEVWGGPNYLYSLTQARNNFVDHLNQYDMDDPYCDDDNNSTRNAKRYLMAIFDKLEQEMDEDERETLWLDVLSAEETLRNERRVPFNDKDWVEERGQKWLAYREKKQPGYLARRERSVAIWRARHPHKGDS